MSLNTMMNEFNGLYSLKQLPISDKQSEMVQLIEEELIELKEEIGVTEPENYIKEAIDIIYVTAQQLRMHGVDIDAALNEVHRSNMSKRIIADSIEDAKVELYRAQDRYPNAAITLTHDCQLTLCDLGTGKIIKPTTYSPAVITKEMF